MPIGIEFLVPRLEDVVLECNDLPKNWLLFTVKKTILKTRIFCPKLRLYTKTTVTKCGIDTSEIQLTRSKRTHCYM